MEFVLSLAIILTGLSVIEIIRSYRRIKAVKPLLGVVKPEEDSYGPLPTKKKKVK
jgi:hypothetical protein